MFSDNSFAEPICLLKLLDGACLPTSSSCFSMAGAWGDAKIEASQILVANTRKSLDLTLALAAQCDVLLLYYLQLELQVSL